MKTLEICTLAELCLISNGIEVTACDLVTRDIYVNPSFKNHTPVPAGLPYVPTRLLIREIANVLLTTTNCSGELSIRITRDFADIKVEDITVTSTTAKGYDRVTYASGFLEDNGGIDRLFEVVTLLQDKFHISEHEAIACICAAGIVRVNEMYKQRNAMVSGLQPCGGFKRDEMIALSAMSSKGADDGL